MTRRRRFWLGAPAASLAVALAWAHWPATRLPRGAVADRVLVEKAARRLSVFRDQEVLATYGVALGREPGGAKEREGDLRTPEGRYTIDARNPASRFHRGLHISYPSPEDRARAVRLGVSPGGDVMIHGVSRGVAWAGRLHRVVDWTAGCIAVTNAEMDELWEAVPVGTPIEIVP